MQTTALKSFTPHDNHPLHGLSFGARSLLEEAFGKSQSPANAFQQLDIYLLKSSIDLQTRFETEEISKPLAVTGPDAVAERLRIEAAFRVLLTREYFRRLQKCFKASELDISTFTQPVLKRLLDVQLRGSAAERVAAHLQLFGPSLNEERTQECLYSLYEPEINTCQKLFLLNPALHKHHSKRMAKFARTYLLDRVDLNTKIRYPDYSGGFQVLAQDLRIDASKLTASLRENYDGASEVGQQFMRDYANSRQEFYNTKAENRKTLMQGVAFFIATCLLDWALSSM
ncbi:hypothetical protein B484DRAFT_397507 [Ochromonadaceae sp. CCMP2298]|nr:hypothetical protein B484DRAFT_397507 [Ochromonadaceae sp. CCMP2298]